MSPRCSIAFGWGGCPHHVHHLAQIGCDHLHRHAAVGSDFRSQLQPLV
jgi:hypothetical protein